MTFSQSLAELRRPKTLVRAAQIKLSLTKASRILDNQKSTGFDETLLRDLLSQESKSNAQRVSCDARYSIERHISLLCAIMREIRHLSAVASD